MAKLINAFKSLNDVRKETFHLIGDICFVQVLDQEVKTKSGLVLADHAKQIMNGVGPDKPTICRVLMVGEGEVDADGNDLPLEVNVGDIVIVGKHAVKIISSLGNTVLHEDKTEVGMIKAAEIQMRFFGEEAYKRVASILQETVG